MTDTIAPRNRQLEMTQAVLDQALETHGFDFGVFISVRVSPDGRCKVECALSGDGRSRHGRAGARLAEDGVMSGKKTTQLGQSGKYDEITENLCRDLNAGAVVLIVLEGRHGTGMSVAAQPDHRGLAFGEGLAELLRTAAGKLDSGEVTGPRGARFTNWPKEET